MCFVHSFVYTIHNKKVKKVTQGNHFHIHLKRLFEVIYVYLFIFSRIKGSTRDVKHAVGDKNHSAAFLLLVIKYKSMAVDVLPRRKAQTFLIFNYKISYTKDS